MLERGIPRVFPSGDSATLERLILRATGAQSVELGERVQALWGGYGEIRRAALSGATASSVIVKYVVPPATVQAERDAESARSHRRKLRSYQVEQTFYRQYAARCGDGCRVPSPIHLSAEGGRILFILEDLDAAGFGLRSSRVSKAELHAGLRWLASFHAKFLGVRPDGLWKVGCYWHLATRPDELQALPDQELRRAAAWLDEQLNRAHFCTLVHGDAKLQNFCFAADASAVAAVDFQYAGAGVGVKDVAYFLSSCLSAERLEREAASHLDDYFRALASELRQSHGSGLDAVALENEWRALYPLACADFYRFLQGWASGSAARDRYLEAVTLGVLKGIDWRTRGR